LPKPIRIFSPDGAEIGPLRSKRVTNEQTWIRARCHRLAEARRRVRDDIADGILALHDLDNPESICAREGHGQHRSIGHIQALADGHHLASSFIAELACHCGRCRDQEEEGGQHTLEPSQQGRPRK
jgi:hypothetical protein